MGSSLKSGSHSLKLRLVLRTGAGHLGRPSKLTRLLHSFAKFIDILLMPGYRIEPCLAHAVDIGQVARECFGPQPR